MGTSCYDLNVRLLAPAINFIDANSDIKSRSTVYLNNKYYK